MINIISRKILNNLYEKHICISLVIAKFMIFNSGSEILDIEQEAGFLEFFGHLFSTKYNLLWLIPFGKKIR